MPHRAVCGGFQRGEVTDVAAMKLTLTAAQLPVNISAQDTEVSY